MRMIADCGATNLRAAPVEAGRPGPIRRYRTAETEGPAALIARFAADAGAPVRQVALAVAAPVTGDAISYLNAGWSFSRTGLAEAAGLDRLIVVNDLAAVALALPRLSPDDMPLLGDGPDTGAPDAAIAVIGPGSGLGVAGLLPDGRVLPTEGGHVSLAPETEAEDRVAAVLRARYGHLSAERVLSGPGLAALYEALGGAEKTPAEVAEGGLSGADPLAAEAVGLFTDWLGRFAGSIALAMGARGGVVLAGGILPGWGQRFDGARFRAAFLSKGRVNPYLAAIPTRLLIHDEPALVGLAGLLDG